MMFAPTPTPEPRYGGTTGNIRLVMIPTLGLFYTILLIVVTCALIFVSRFHTLLRWICLGLAVIQIFFTTLLWFNPTTWQFGIFLLATGLFGIYALLNMNENFDHLFWFLVLTLLNSAVGLGTISIINGHDYMTSVAGHYVCSAMYGYQNHDDQCDGYNHFAEFLAYVVILIQPLQAFLLYVLYKHGGNAQSV
eukprot:TRINITY_DN11317_c0_g1_i1.p1 TRINITY_DN11317_c0_g1~~TRINITY_DN11317_c0_g1_i1.p1  ORF type:complete len:204 (+),score=29.70 TRINITY_DN11317_c0_g1_i1:36-614(+)